MPIVLFSLLFHAAVLAPRAVCGPAAEVGSAAAYVTAVPMDDDSGEALQFGNGSLGRSCPTQGPSDQPMPTDRLFGEAPYIA